MKVRSNQQKLSQRETWIACQHYETNFKIWTRVWSHDICLVFFLFLNIYISANLDSYFLLHSVYFTSLTYVLCFQHVFTIGIILSATERHTCSSFRYYLLIGKYWMGSWPIRVRTLFMVNKCHLYNACRVVHKVNEEIKIYAKWS